ncbi:hypothetical protein [Reinekea sp.]|jgi:hypothetical protein|uniref:hypothetical protein n=1 Tax=Reinekea sp. TaxID=1970455 RepID=UPI003989C19C
MFKFCIALAASFCFSVSLAQANPMRPDNMAAPKSTATTTAKPKVTYFSLSDISIIGDLRYAYINKQQLTLNDLINGYRVAQIEADYVLLIKGNSERTLYLKSPGSFKIVPSTEDYPSE